jgi:hypothetical protein
MLQPTLTIIIPTVSRSTLATTLQSLAPQLVADDQVLVIGDGEQPLARKLVSQLPTPPWHYFEHGPTRDTGRSQREFGITHSTSDYLCFMDDDDCFVESALRMIRTRATEHPGRPLMFRMDDRGGAIRWGRPELAYGNVGTPMFVIPNIADKIGRWDENDYHFIRHTVELQGEPVWLEDIIAIVRPHEPRHSASG